MRLRGVGTGRQRTADEGLRFSSCSFSAFVSCTGCERERTKAERISKPTPKATPFEVAGGGRHSQASQRCCRRVVLPTLDSTAHLNHVKKFRDALSGLTASGALREAREDLAVLASRSGEGAVIMSTTRQRVSAVDAAAVKVKTRRRACFSTANGSFVCG